MSKVVEYQLEDCGVDHAQYFQGAGVSNTEWDYVYLGAGESAREAIDDAIDQACSSLDADCSALQGINLDTEGFSLAQDAHKDCDSEDDDDQCELYHYAAVYVKIGEG